MTGYDRLPLADQNLFKELMRVRVLNKENSESVGGDLERRAFERLVPHPNIVRYLGRSREGSLILERGKGFGE